MQMILTHQGVRVQANSQQENEDGQIPDLILISTNYGQFEIKREHAEAVCRLIGMAHNVTRRKDGVAAGPDNVVPMMFRRQAD